MVDTNDPAPAADGPRAGERWVKPDSVRWQVYQWTVRQQPKGGERLIGVWVGSAETEEDARLLCSGGELARLRAENERLRAVLTEAESLMEEASLMEPCKSECGCCAEIIKDRKECLEKMRAALAAAPPEPGSQ